MSASGRQAASCKQQVREATHRPLTFTWTEGMGSCRVSGCTAEACALWRLHSFTPGSRSATCSEGYKGRLTLTMEGIRSPRHTARSRLLAQFQKFREKPAAKYEV